MATRCSCERDMNAVSHPLASWYQLLLLGEQGHMGDWMLVVAHLELLVRKLVVSEIKPGTLWSQSGPIP